MPRSTGALPVSATFRRESVAGASGPRIEYVGFKDTGSSREYSLRVQQGANPSRTFVLAIVNEAFSSRTARLQDGPDICYQRLLRVLAALDSEPDHIVLSEADLYEYRHAHAPKPPRRRAPAVTPTPTGDGDGDRP
jgi:hypothetical protein